MKRRVVFEETALADLRELFAWIADRAGVGRAEIYTSRIKAYCEGFDLFPLRGIRRDDIKPGLRIIGFERRVTIAFVVLETEVKIVRLLYGGRDIGLLTEEQEPRPTDWPTGYGRSRRCPCAPAPGPRSRD